MSWFAESPWPGVGLGVLLAIMFVAGFLQTGRKSLLAVAAACLLLGLALALLEAKIVTDREQVTDTIHELAGALEQNRDEVILEAIHSLAPEIKNRADKELKLYVFTRVDVKNNLRVVIDSDHQPPIATAKFNVVAETTLYPRPVPRFIELEFSKDTDGTWRIRNYRHAPPQEGFMKTAP